MATSEQTRDRAAERAGLTPEELAAMIEEARGAELSDEQLEQVSGGKIYLGDELPEGWTCPECGASDYRWHPGGCMFICNKCGEVF